MIKDNAVDSFWEEHFEGENRKLLFILGKGFDVRMNFALSRLLNSCPDINLECLLIEFDEGTTSSSLDYKPFVTENMMEFEKIMDGRTVRTKKIKMKNKIVNHLLSLVPQMCPANGYLMTMTVYPESVFSLCKNGINCIY